MNDKYPEEAEKNFTPSKSQKKRQMLAVQGLCDELAKLNPEVRASLELPDPLEESIQIASRIKASSARNRQLRHAAKILVAEDDLLDSVSAYFEALKNEARHTRQRHKLIEQWRDRLLDNNEDALSELFNHYPETDRQELSTLVRNARKEQHLGKSPAQQRKLFKYLRDFVLTPEAL